MPRSQSSKISVRLPLRKERHGAAIRPTDGEEKEHHLVDVGVLPTRSRWCASLSPFASIVALVSLGVVLVVFFTTIPSYRIATGGSDDGAVITDVGDVKLNLKAAENEQRSPVSDEMKQVRLGKSEMESKVEVEKVGEEGHAIDIIPTPPRIKASSRNSDAKLCSVWDSEWRTIMGRSGEGSAVGAGNNDKRGGGRGVRHTNIHMLGEWPPNAPNFSQVWSPHIGFVDYILLENTLRDLAIMAETHRHGEMKNKSSQRSKHLNRVSLRGVGADSKKPLLVLFAVDGTLLNLLRWGRIHNDNDIDLGFYFLAPIEKGRKEEKEGKPRFHTMDQYYQMLDALAGAGIIHPPSARDRKRFHSSTESVKVGKCKHRGQLMQCRHKDTGVYIDLFGPDTIFSPVSGVSLEGHLLPLRACRSFGFEFPCPNKPLEALRMITLDTTNNSTLVTRNKSEEGGEGTNKATNQEQVKAEAERSDKEKERPPSHSEFSGCPLFPLKRSEQTLLHLISILSEGKRLRGCGYPNMLPSPSRRNDGRVDRETREEGQSTFAFEEGRIQKRDPNSGGSSSRSRDHQTQTSSLFDEFEFPTECLRIIRESSRVE